MRSAWTACTRPSQSLPVQHFLPRPPAARLDGGGSLVSDGAAVAAWTAELEAAVARHGHELAGIIVEPVLQGAGGMHAYSPECLQALRRVADAHGLLLIFDEIATGFGRTGKLFAGEWAGVVPDVMCVGKALTGGYLTLAAVLCSTTVADVITALRIPGPPARARPSWPTRWPARWPRPRCSCWKPPAGRSRCAASKPACARPWPRRPGLGSVRDVRVLGAVGVVELHDAGRRPGGDPRRAGARVSGCARSATSSTPCRRTSARRLTWRRSAPASVAAVKEVHG